MSNVNISPDSRGISYHSRCATEYVDTKRQQQGPI